MTRLSMRAVAIPEVANPGWAVIIDVPLTTSIESRIQQETGIRMGEITARLADRVSQGDLDAPQHTPEPPKPAPRPTEAEIRRDERQRPEGSTTAPPLSRSQPKPQT